MPASDQKTDVLPQRLCSEIQLFDLCDSVSCTFKSGRFCTDPDLLGRFEKIAEDELSAPERYITEEIDGAEVDDGDEFNDEDESFAEENSEGDEDDGWEDEE